MSEAVVRPMRADEYDAFYAKVQEGYVADMVAAGVEEDVARAKSDRDHAAALPKGFDTPKHFLYTIDHDGEAAGFLWLADRAGELGRDLFVFALEVDEAYRGRGLGRTAMLFAEQEAQRLGIPKVALNVFGANDVARGLYRSLGYAETAVYMEKAL